MLSHIQIFSISMVKNEMDVIESFVRYNLNILDGMIILDNGSTDDTLKILKLLKKEGLPVFILEDQDKEFKHAKKMNLLLLKAINEYNADIIVPLDADEFIISNNGNPRKILEKIDTQTFHYVKWKTYVPNFERNDQFIPARITRVRDESVETFHKVVLPKELVINHDVKLTTGSHDLLFEPEYANNIKSVFNAELRIAHFPIRSKEQTISKIVVSWIYFLSRLERMESDGFHWQKIYNKLKEEEVIENEDIIEIAKEYSVIEVISNISVYEDPIDLTFCKNIEIIYTDDNLKPISNILKAIEWLSISKLNYEQETIHNKKQFENKISNLSFELDETKSEADILNKKVIELTNNLAKVNADINTINKLKDKINAYENSKSWKITSPLRKFKNKISKVKNEHKRG